MKTLRLALPLAAAALFAALGCEETPPNPSAKPVPRETTSAAPTATATAAALTPMPKAAPLPATPAPLPELKTPAENALTAEKVALGKQLFFDKRLSKDRSASCETCHVP